MEANFNVLDEGVLLVSLDLRCTQVGFNLVCSSVNQIANSHLMIKKGSIFT